MVGEAICASAGGIGVANICDHDDADDKQFQGAVSIVGPDQNIYPRYLTLYENGILQFSKLNQVKIFKTFLWCFMNHFSQMTNLTYQMDQNLYQKIPLKMIQWVLAGIMARYHVTLFNSSCRRMEKRDVGWFVIQLIFLVTILCHF